MAKSKSIFVCQNCGAQAPKWMGRCPDCDAWNSYAEETVRPATATAEKARGLGRGEARVITLESPESFDVPTPVSTGMDEFDRVLGGGIVPGSFTLIGGDPGIGKSTLMLQTLSSLAQVGRKVLYISGEESVGQTQMRAKRLGARGENLYLASETNLEVVLDLCRQVNPFLVVIDSIQTAFLPDLQSAPGSVTQVRECAAKLMYLAKTEGVAVLLVGHITKEGSIAGPKVLEHMVDTVLAFEGDPNHLFRLLRAIKNRFGPANELGVFEMSGGGLREVKNPSELFLSERGKSVPGSVVFSTVEGTRPFLVEVQALATPTNMSMPRRTAIGVDPNRVHLLLAILDKHLELKFYAHDVFVNVVGGVKISEPAVDLAIAAALISSLESKPIRNTACFFGELGLTGEVRGVPLPELRLKEAQKLGFDLFSIPAANKKTVKAEKGIHFVQSVQDLHEFI